MEFENKKLLTNYFFSTEYLRKFLINIKPSYVDVFPLLGENSIYNLDTIFKDIKSLNPAFNMSVNFKHGCVRIYD